MEIRSKEEFFRLWEQGVLGNRTRLWRNSHDAFDWGFQQRIKKGLDPEIGFRELRKSGAGSGKWEKVNWNSVLSTAKQWQAEGRNFIMDDTAPNDKTTLCGEICRTFRGLEGTLGVTGCGMREAIKKGLLLPRSGATVLALLDRYMDDNSREDLNILLDLFPDATVELSCFTVDVGVFPNRNTLFWEIRNY